MEEKKKFEKPMMKVVQMQQHGMICVSHCPTYCSDDCEIDSYCDSCDHDQHWHE